MSGEEVTARPFLKVPNENRMLSSFRRVGAWLPQLIWSQTPARTKKERDLQFCQIRTLTILNMARDHHLSCPLNKPPRSATGDRAHQFFQIQNRPRIVPIRGQHPSWAQNRTVKILEAQVHQHFQI